MYIFNIKFNHCVIFLFSGMMKPSGGQFISYLHVLFEWDQEPDTISYNIQVSRSNQFTNLLIDLDTLIWCISIKIKI